MTTVGEPVLPARLAARYRCDEFLGHGVDPSTVVFRAHDTLLSRPVAVKIFVLGGGGEGAEGPGELPLLASLDHPALVPVLDIDAADGRAVVVMALLDGGSLLDRLSGGRPLDLPTALRTATAVADALDHVHRTGASHRAVCPGNVLYDSEDRAHLADFGVAHLSDPPRVEGTDLVAGLVPYLAPEQVRGGPAGPAADVYALALVLLEALRGAPAFAGATLASARARLEQPPTLPSDLPAPVVGLLRAMTADEPEARPSAATASGLLRRALVEAEPAPVPTVVIPVPVSGSGPFAGHGRFSTTPARSAAGIATGEGLGAAAAADAPRWSGVAGTRTVVALAGLAASALLAGTVTFATSDRIDTATVASAPATLAPAAAPQGATAGAAGSSDGVGPAPSTATGGAGATPAAPGSAVGAGIDRPVAETLPRPAGDTNRLPAPAGPTGSDARPSSRPSSSAPSSSGTSSSAPSSSGTSSSRPSSSRPSTTSPSETSETSPTGTPSSSPTTRSSPSTDTSTTTPSDRADDAREGGLVGDVVEGVGDTVGGLVGRD